MKLASVSHLSNTEKYLICIDREPMLHLKHTLKCSFSHELCFGLIGWIACHLVPLFS